MPRSTPEWIGATPDTPAPPRVRLRVFERYGGKGGKNVESNLAPILRGKPHKEKTAADVAEKSKVARMRAKHLGIFPKSKARIQSRGFPSTRPLSERGKEQDAR